LTLGRWALRSAGNRSRTVDLWMLHLRTAQSKGL